MHLLDSTIA